MSESPTEAVLADAMSELRDTTTVSLEPNKQRQNEDSNEESAEGNNSDNSSGGLLSIGNNSFGFNFENDDSLGGRNSGNSDGNNSDDRKSDSVSFSNALEAKMAAPMTNSNRTTTGLSSLTSSSANNSVSITNDDQNNDEESKNAMVSSSTGTDSFSLPEPKNVDDNRKRKAANAKKTDAKKTDASTSQEDNAFTCGTDDLGYSDNESFANSNQNDESNKGGRSKKKKRLDENKREERNQREKERSFRISKQITELRDLLSNGGVVVPKGTKSSVLTEAASYIRMLQQHQYRSEIDRHQLIQQMQLIGQGAHGPQAAQAIRHFAAQNGVWSLGNFGGVPPKSAMEFTQSSATSSSPDTATTAAPSDSNVFQQNKVEPSEYRFIFNSCGVGMAIASMGGAFVDCNQLFCQLSNYEKQEVCGMTIFNMTARSDLQRAFDQISQLISPPIDEISQSTEGGERQPITFRGSFKTRDDLGLCVSLVKGEDGVSKCFCVTLVKNPTSPFENSQPIAASFDSVIPSSATEASMKMSQTNASPAFTSG